MRRFTRFAPFSQLALSVAIGALGVTLFAAPAHAADPAKPTSSPKAAPAAKAPAAKSATPDKKTKDAARKAYGEGEKAYAAGDFSAAYTGYSKANELIPSAQASYWAAKSLDQGGKTEDAIAGYEALLADPNASKIGEDKLADANARLAAEGLAGGRGNRHDCRSRRHFAGRWGPPTRSVASRAQAQPRPAQANPHG